MRFPLATLVTLIFLCFFVDAVEAPANAAESLTLLSQARSVTAESFSDLDGTGSNPDKPCTLDEFSESDAPDFEPFEARALVQPVQYECHTLLTVSADAYQSSRLSSTSFEFEGYVRLESWGLRTTDQGGHVLGSSPGSVVFQLTEGVDYELTGALSAGAAGRSSLRIVDTTNDATLVSRVAVDDTDDFDLAGRLTAGTYEFRVEAEGECGRDCTTHNAYQATMYFHEIVPVSSINMGTLKARY